MTEHEKYLQLKEQGLILFEAIVGSQSYGTALPTSDIDKKFVYIDTLDNLLSNNVTQQLNVTKDYVGYEIGRYLELVQTNNPNILELLASPNDCIIYCHPLFKEILINQKQLFLSKQCGDSFGGYANTQIKKARGLNKKIVNPIEGEKKTVLDFCWVPKAQGSQNIKEWLKERNLQQENCGLVSIEHMKYTYHLFYDFSMTSELNYKGLIQKGNDSNDVSLSSVPKGEVPVTVMYFNLEGYSKYCKDYTSYKTWLKERNEERYQNNMNNGASYDAKNMLHCHRLLDMAIEILRDNEINVRRPNREQLLEIRAGKYTYDQLLKDAEEKIILINGLSKMSMLPDELDDKFIRAILADIRSTFYKL